MARRSRRDDDDYYDEEERSPRYASHSQKQPIIPFIAVGAVVVAIGLLIMLSASKKAEERETARRESPHLSGMDVPDAPGYQKLRDVEQSSVKSADNLVLGVYSYGRHSTVNALKRASKGYWNHRVRFIIADHDISRLTLTDLKKAGVLSSEVITTDCPLTIFISNGRESYREKDMTYGALQRQIDDLFHGGKSSMPSDS